ncbi:MAG: ABC transporter ATP-binding protein, partial [Pseudomonadota bacterium]
LARIMARRSNLLVLDEPTNDLDVETLDLLQELVAEFDGTVLMVSHDRDFIDRVATATVAMEGGGEALVYAGGWQDYQAQKPEVTRPVAVRAAKPAPSPAPSREVAPGLTGKQAHRLKQLPDEIARLEREIAKLESFLSDPELFTREPAKFQKASLGLEERRIKLDAAEEEWLDLEALREAAP